MKTPGRVVLAAAFAAFLLSFAVWAARNHRVQLYSDPATYLRFAESLARGEFFVDYPPDRLLAAHYSPQALYLGTYATTVIHEGRGMVLYAVGYPLYLAAFILVGGRYAPVFANAAVFLALLVLIGVVTRRIFGEDRRGRAAALAAPVLYVLFNRQAIFTLLAPYRDPLSHLLLLGALGVLLGGSRGPRRAAPFVLSGLLFGLAALVRETSVLALPPLALLAVWQLRSAARGQALRLALAFGLGALLGVLPLLVQNGLNTGNPFYPTQMLHNQVKFGEIDDAAGAKGFGMKALSPANFPSTAPRLLRVLLHDFQPAFLGLLLIGLWAGWRQPAVRLFLVPFVLMYLLFFGCYTRAINRYIFIAQIALAPLLGLGLAESASRLGRLLRAEWLPTAAACAASVATVGVLLVSRESGLFQVRDAEEFRRDFEARVPAGAVVFAGKPMHEVLPALTYAYGVRQRNFVREQAGISLAEGVRYYAERFPGTYFLDSADIGSREGYDDSGTTREQLLERNDLSPVGEFAAARYHLVAEFGRESVTLSRLDPWRREAVVRRVPAPPGGGGVLRLNGRGAPPTGMAAEVSLGGVVLGTTIAGGLNWFPVPAGVGGGGFGELRVTSAGPLARELDPVWLDADAALVLDAGPAAIPLDTAFLAGDFSADVTQGSGRSFRGEGIIRVPVLPQPASLLVVAARFQPASLGDGEVLGLQCSGGGAATVFALRDGGHWRTVSFPVEHPDPGAATATIRLQPQSRRPPATQRPPLFSVDRVTVHRLRPRPLPIAIDFGTNEEPLVIDGLHNPERIGTAGAVRWTNGSARLRLFVSEAAAGVRARLSLRLYGPPVELAGNRLKVAINGTPVGEAGIVPRQAQEAIFPVPAGLLRQGVNEVTIDSPPWRPAALYGSPDTRTLGVMLDSLRLEPQPAAGGP